MDQIVVLKNGVTAETGGYNELMQNKGLFYRLIKDYAQQEQTQSKPANKTAKNAAGISISTCTSGTPTPKNMAIGGRDKKTNTANSTAPPRSKDQNKGSKGKLTTVEAIKEGSVDWDVTVAYMRAMSFSTSALIVLLFAIAQGCLVSASLWLKHWITKTKESAHDSASLSQFLSVYATITLVYVLIYMAVIWLGFAVARVRAAERIHTALLARIFSLSVAFFDTTPLGRIINRFSSDMTLVDTKISQSFMDTLLYSISVCSTLLLVAFTTIEFIAVVPFLLVAYWLVLRCFQNVARFITRLYAISKSPIYQHFNETLGGVSTIRAFNVESMFITTSAALTDRATNNFVCKLLVFRWLDAHLRGLSSIVLLSAALFAVLGRDSIDTSLVGLTLSFAMALTGEVTSTVRSYSDFQNQLVSLERILEYTKLKTEAPEKTDVILPPKWPSRGHVRFINYSTRYREGLDLVVRNVDLDIKPTEKVGIVGRTGAGKSSLTLALFRIIEAANSYWAQESDNNESPSGGADTNGRREDEVMDGGRIEIDGVDISTVGLDDLRKNLAIIPQDPTLFAGSVRDNLDPFHEHKDQDLWEALDRSHLKEYISTLPGGLLYEVAQNGENFSVGQRSLICLARALLRKTKILVLDEATAAVDVETDELIQRTIRKEFKDRTILTIAHRIKTVMDSDKILVLDQGRVSEFDTPGRLLGKDSLFLKLAVQAGEVQQR
ncbi:Canalicular multispecific organic anion transporter 1 [Mortierella sp. GBA43]|nr:Canalicular multispecific organic anion transporter 1 [Mortierella sp. GBA43]